MNGWQIVFGFLASIGGLAGLTSMFLLFANRRKLDAETSRTGVDTDIMLSKEARELYLLTRQEAQEAKTEAQACRKEVAALRDHVDHLERMMRDEGLTPPPFRWPPMAAVDI